MMTKLSICMFNPQKPPIWGNFKIRQMNPFKTPPKPFPIFLKLPNKGLPLHKSFLPFPSPPKPNSQTKPKGVFIKSHNISMILQRNRKFCKIRISSCCL